MNSELNAWNVENVTTMNWMFSSAYLFDQNLGSWNITSIFSMVNMLSQSGMSSDNYDATLIGWSSQTLQEEVNLGAEEVYYCNAEAERQSIIDNFGWTITDNGYNVDCNVPDNTIPLSYDQNGHAFTEVSTNIQLDVSDQDGDILTYTIIDPPTNGTAIITETSGGGVLTYISNAGFEGTETFTYKANDGTADSNTAQVSINVFEKEPNLNWATYYSSTEMHSSKKDNEGNTYTVGTFYDFSNFIDNTTLNAVYPNGDRDGYIAKYNEDGELLWSNTFGGIYRDRASDIAIASDGNVIVSGSIRRVATFSDGEELGDINNDYNRNYSVILKLDSNSGEIIWKHIPVMKQIIIVAKKIMQS